jgi:hypothetical protein
MLCKGYLMKNSIVENIQKAKESHLSQLHYIQLLVKGITLDEKKIYKNQYECIFGQWLFGEGEKLKEKVENSGIEEIERLHASWHDEYLKIFQIYFTKKAGFFAKFLGNSAEISPMQTDKAKLYLSELEQTTAQLIKKLDSLMRKINALGISNLN